MLHVHEFSGRYSRMRKVTSSPGGPTGSTVVLVDDHPIFIDGLKATMQTSLPSTILHCFNDSVEALGNILQIAPDLVITDLSMPHLSGLELAEKLVTSGYAGKLIVLTSFTSPEFMEHALDLGIKGYLLKECSADELVYCLEKVYRDETYVSRELLTRQSGIAPVDLAVDRLHLEVLTDTERLVLRYLGDFMTNKQIARELDISYRTVQNHRYNISKKLASSGSHQLLQVAATYRALL